MVDVIANNRYQAVKAQLDSLHYCQPFSNKIVKYLTLR
jgi:hypothetical protein